MLVSFKLSFKSPCFTHAHSFPQVGELQNDALIPANIDTVTQMFGALTPAQDSKLFVRVFRKPKANVALPHIDRSTEVPSKQASGGAEVSDSDSDASSSSDGEKK